ncbi:unnamed protein product, partial [Prorocentrum cordatum]
PLAQPGRGGGRKARMARDAAASSENRAAAGRARRGAAGARASADRLVKRLAGQLVQAEARLAVAEETLSVLVGGSEAAQRVQALLPALQAKLDGRVPEWIDVLRGNVGLRADAVGVDVATATADAQELRRAQRGPRLEARQFRGPHDADLVGSASEDDAPAPAAVVRSTLRAEAGEFVFAVVEKMALRA